jgi:hypothetical protein
MCLLAPGRMTHHSERAQRGWETPSRNPGDLLAPRRFSVAKSLCHQRNAQKSSARLNPPDQTSADISPSPAGECDQLRREPARLAISARDRNAALTAAAFGNRSASSGSRTTTFELVWSRSMYFPRTNGPKSERLYSARSSSAASFLGLPHELPLCPRCVAKRTLTFHLSSVYATGR